MLSWSEQRYRHLLCSQSSVIIITSRKISDVENEARMGKQEVDADVRTDIRTAVRSFILKNEAPVSSKILAELYQTNNAM
jgi:hypothetical protein